MSSVADRKIRAVLTDVDGTLLGRDLSISDANREAITRATRAGVPVILATGRIPSETVGYYRELGLSTPLVCYHGALVLRDGRLPLCNGYGGTALVDACLPGDLARKLVQFILGEHPQAQVLVGLADRYVINRLGELADHWDMSGPSRPRIGSLDESLQQRIYKLCYFSTEPLLVNDTMRRVELQFAERVSQQQAHAHLAEFLAPGVSKVAGADAALRAIGLGWHEVMAVGDYHNDLEMLGRAAIGVAMDNAADEVKAAADFVTADRDEDGLAMALKRFVL